MDDAPPSLLGLKSYDAESVFRPENLLREARRQKRLPSAQVPPICVLDPDGDLASRLLGDGRARRDQGWACYHTELVSLAVDGERFGIVGRAVGAPFAVLVAEQLFASGCQLLISVTSAGQITATGPTPYFVLIDKALRDEGTSYHYLPPSLFAEVDAKLADRVFAALARKGFAIHRGMSWTTDAPFRETEDQIALARRHGVLAVEMEAAGLYALARARARQVVCFAYVTNQLAQIDGDFEKGEADGAGGAIALIAATARAWRRGHDRA